MAARVESEEVPEDVKLKGEMLISVYDLDCR